MVTTTQGATLVDRDRIVWIEENTFLGQELWDRMVAAIARFGISANEANLSVERLSTPLREGHWIHDWASTTDEPEEFVETESLW